MPLLFYCAVLAIVLGNVLFGLDWMSAPMSPMPETALALQSAPAAVAAPAPVRPAAPAVAVPDAVQQAETAAPEKPAQPSCNVDACTRAYRSFHASDCTYLPTGGPRRRCEK
jgi:penicillin-binding protein 1A